MKLPTGGSLTVGASSSETIMLCFPTSLYNLNTMRWPPWSSNSDREHNDKSRVSWTDSLNATDWSHFTEPRTLVPALLLATAFTATYLASRRVYKSYIRRIPGTAYIKPGFFRRKSLFGTVTRVGDGDNFHFFHQPGGRLMGWGWLRKIPEKNADLKGNTIPIRLAGIDAPEGAHFGKPAQPYSSEALEWLRNYILDQRVRAYIYKPDQYDRVVASVWIRKRNEFFRRDVAKEMLRAGFATVYEAQSGAEFGDFEKKYRRIEAWAKITKKGMWAGDLKNYESPRDFKIRTASEPKQGEKKIPGFWRRLIWWQ